MKSYSNSIVTIPCLVIAFATATVFHANAAPGDITTVAGDGTGGAIVPGVDALYSSVSYPFYLATDSEGNLYNSGDSRPIMRIDAGTNILTLPIGTTSAGDPGDGGPADEANFVRSQGVAFDLLGNTYIADMFGHRIRKVDASTGIIDTIAGDGNPGFSGDGGPSTEAQVNGPQALTVDRNGNIYFADDGLTRIRRIDASTGIITTIAGDGDEDYEGDGGPAVDASFDLIRGLCFDANGDLFISDSNNHCIRKIDMSTGIVTKFAGLSPATPVEDVPALAARLYFPMGIAIDSAGNLFISDYGHDLILMVDGETGFIRFVAGTGTGGYSGDGGSARAAEINGPRGLALDAEGNLYFADSDNYVIRKIEKIAAPASFRPTGSISQSFGRRGEGLPQSLRVKSTNRKQTFYFQTQSQPYFHFFDTYAIRSSGKHRDFKVKYISLTDGNVTAQLRAGQVQYSGEDSNASKSFKVKAKAKRSTRPVRGKFLITSRSQKDPTGVSALKAKVKILPKK